MTQEFKQNNKKKLILLTIAFAVVVAGLSLQGCTETPTNPSQTTEVPKTEVGSNSAVAPVQLTTNLEPNPHLPSHYGEPNCSYCHDVKSKNEIVCLECHFMDWPTDKLVKQQ